MSNQKTIREITEEIKAHDKAIADLANMAGEQIAKKLSESDAIERIVVSKEVKA